MKFLVLFFLLFAISSAKAQLPLPAQIPDHSPAQVPPAQNPSPAAKSNASGPPLSINGISIKGLSDQAALAKLRRSLAPLLQRRVALYDGKQTFWRTRAELGASIPYAKLLHDAKLLAARGGGDVPLRFEVSIKKATVAMQKWAAKADHEAAMPSLDVSHGQVVQNGGAGFELAVDGSAWRVKKAIEAQPSQIYVPLVSRQIPAAGGQDISPFKYLLAEFTTRYNAGVRGRTVNLKMSAKNINGTIVPEGSVFSANRTIGPRDAKHGWQEAKMFVNGDVVDGIGAGICQTATTLYNAVLLAGLPIVERHQHQFRVYYAPPSRDATLYWGEKDFKFRNNTSGPIYMQTLVGNSHYTVRLYGVQPVKEKITLESKVLSRHEGSMRSEAFRTIGNKRELLSRDFYKPEPPEKH